MNTLSRVALLCLFTSTASTLVGGYASLPWGVLDRENEELHEQNRQWRDLAQRQQAALEQANTAAEQRNIENVALLGQVAERDTTIAALRRNLAVANAQRDEARRANQRPTTVTNILQTARVVVNTAQTVRTGATAGNFLWKGGTYLLGLITASAPAVNRVINIDHHRVVDLAQFAGRTLRNS